MNEKPKEKKPWVDKWTTADELRHIDYLVKFLRRPGHKSPKLILPNYIKNVKRRAYYGTLPHVDTGQVIEYAKRTLAREINNG